MRNTLKFFSIAACMAIVTACGGGGGGSADTGSSSSSSSSNSSGGGSSSSSGGSSSGGSSTAQGVTVVPSLGAFSSGATVELFDAATGNPIGSPVTTGSNGTAVIDLGSQTTSFVIKVTGAATGVTYYDEGTDRNLPLLASHSLLAMVPTSVALSGNARIGVTPLTHMAAAFAGLSNSSLKVVPASINDTVPFTIAKAYARVRYAMGLGSVTSSLETYLNPLIAPTTLSSLNHSSGIDLSTQGGYYGLLLAELANAGTNSTPSYTPIEFAQALASAANDLVASNYSSTAINTFTASAPRLVLSTATNAVGTGSSAKGYINTCVTVTADAGPYMRNAMSSASNTTNLSANVDQLAQTILAQTLQQLDGTTINMTATRSTANGCV